MLDFRQMQGEGEYLLIETDDWFTAPNGQKYKSVWGKCKVLDAKEILGFKPSQSTNWYLQVGSDEKAMFVAGCRIHYAHVCLEQPKGNDTYKIV